MQNSIICSEMLASTVLMRASLFTLRVPCACARSASNRIMMDLIPCVYAVFTFSGYVNNGCF